MRAEDVVLDDEGRAGFDLIRRTDASGVELGVPGEHMVSNALAAAACGIALGLSAAECGAAPEKALASRRGGWRRSRPTTACWS